MGVFLKYYVHIRLTSSGKLKHQEIEEAKAFLIEQFSEIEIGVNASDLLIQKLLVQWMKAGSHLAETCLRCYISHSVQSACLNLAQKFGLHQQFSSSELLAYVLDDINPLQPLNLNTSYIPFALKILRTFDPNQSSLSYWTKRLVHQHPQLNQLLSERGIYIASDWAVLNQTNPAQVQRLLSAVLTDSELQQAIALLTSFHAVYRADRIQQGSLVIGKRCLDPSDDQMRRMVECLEATGRSISPSRLLRELRTLASQLRRAKYPPATSLDQVRCPLAIEQPLPSPEEVFLEKYHQVSEDCLLEAIQSVLQQRSTQLRHRNPQQAIRFNKALFLFFVQGKSMGEIAPLVGLKQQFQVTRLLKLKQIRSTISQQYVSLMQFQLQRLLAEDLSSDRLSQLQLEPLLTEMSERMVTEDVTECYSSHRSSKSLFSLCICRFLKSCT